MTGSDTLVCVVVRNQHPAHLLHPSRVHMMLVKYFTMHSLLGGVSETRLGLIHDAVQQWHAQAYHITVNMGRQYTRDPITIVAQFMKMKPHNNNSLFNTLN